MNAQRMALLTGALHGLLAIVCGAIAAHSLHLGVTETGWWNKAVFYQTMHALLLIALGLAPLPGRWQDSITALAGSGALLFSGSLYLLALTHFRPSAYLTPIGGILMLSAWAALALFALTHRAHGR